MQKGDLKLRVNGSDHQSLERVLLDNHYQVILIIKDTFILKSAILEIPYKFSNEKVLLNGFQTWSSTIVVSIDTNDHNLSKLFNKFQGKYGDYEFANYEYLHSWFYTYLKRDSYCRV